MHLLHRAGTSFSQALKYNPDFVPAIGHLIDLAAARDDSADVRQWAWRYFALDSTGELADYFRWRVAVALDNRNARKGVRQHLGELAAPLLERIVNVSQLEEVDLEDAATAAAWVAAESSADTLEVLTSLDSWAGTAPSAVTWLVTAANITASQLWEQHSDFAKALRAIRRRIYITDIDERRVLVALATMLRDEVRLATMAGDTTGAISAAKKYLALRQNPEPELVPQADSVRQELARLQR